MDRSHELYANNGGDQSLEVNLIDHPIPETKNYTRWLRLSIYVFLVLTCKPLATILGRLYFENGGESLSVGILLQHIGFPVLILFRFFSQTKQQSESTKTFPSYITSALVYMCPGLLVIGYAYLFAFGLLDLPVSAFSLILASQLAFTAFFSYFLNSQKFTPLIINSLFLLTVSSSLLVDSENTTNVSRVMGFICTVGASTGIGLLLSLIQLLLRKVFKKHTSSAVMDLAIYQSLVATCIVLVGLFVNVEWETLPNEMRNYKLGKASYVLTLAFIAISWQVYSVGLVGLVFESSSMFSDALFHLLLVKEVVGFVDASNIFSIVLAIWASFRFCLSAFLFISHTKRQAIQTLSKK